ncbi:hypothetical protein Tco_0920172, partial [Tanacetum coccineum]
MSDFKPVRTEKEALMTIEEEEGKGSCVLRVKRVVHAAVSKSTPAWTNTNRVNKANQFTPRPVQLSNIKPNLSTASKTIKTGRVNVNTGHGNVNSGSMHVNSGTQIKSGASRFNTGKQHVNSGSVRVNSGTQIKSGASRFNTGKQHVNSGSVHVNSARVNRPVSNNTKPKKCFSKQRSPVNRLFSRNTAHKSNKYAVKGKMGTAVKTSAGCVWRKVIPLSNTNSGPTPDSNVNDHPLKHMEHRGIFDSGCSGHMTGNRAHLEDYQELSKVGSVTFGGSKGRNQWEKVLLKVPRQHNMYTFDMKNVDSSKGYTCLLAKASSNEAKLWHRSTEEDADLMWVSSTSLTEATSQARCVRENIAKKKTHYNPQSKPMLLDQYPSEKVLKWVYKNKKDENGVVSKQSKAGSSEIYDMDSLMYLTAVLDLKICMQYVYVHVSGNFQSLLNLNASQEDLQVSQERKPNVGLWYPRESPLIGSILCMTNGVFPNLDRKSTIGVVNFLGQMTYLHAMQAWMQRRSVVNILVENELYSVQSPPPITTPTPPHITTPTPPPITTPTPPPIPTPTPPSIPTPTPIPDNEPTQDEHIYKEQSPIHHHFSPPQEQAPSQMPMDDLLHEVPKLISRIDSLETDLKQ